MRLPPLGEVAGNVLLGAAVLVLVPVGVVTAPIWIPLYLFGRLLERITR